MHVHDSGMGTEPLAVQGVDTRTCTWFRNGNRTTAVQGVGIHACTWFRNRNGTTAIQEVDTRCMYKVQGWWEQNHCSAGSGHMSMYMVQEWKQGTNGHTCTFVNR